MGTPIGDADIGRFATIAFRPVARYRMVPGKALGRFLEGLKEGKILGTFCGRCRQTFVPPRMYCSHCFRRVDRWVEVSDRGTVVTAVASYIEATRARASEPKIVGVIRLDVDDGAAAPSLFPGLLHFICGASVDDVVSRRIFGARVEAVWRPREHRTGSITDIECFRVVQ